MIAPPMIEPAKNVTSFAVSRQTSSPNERATSSGVRKITGDTRKNTTPKKTNSVFSTALWPT